MFRLRYLRIVTFFGRVILSIIYWDLILPRIGLRSWAERTRKERLRRSAVSFRLLAIRLGGVMIKVGQFLSSRVDVLPEVITAELAGLQDEVPPEDFADIRRVAETEFSARLEDKFLEFEREPLAAASLGQVHRARLRQGYIPEYRSPNNPTTSLTKPIVDVVVKVQRPDTEKIIKTDLAALHTVGQWLKRYRPIRRRADVPALLNEFTRILYEEIDYLSEGRNADAFRENFQDYPGVCVPHVIWTHTTRRALTLENVLAIKISDYTAIKAAGVFRSEVAARLLDTYLKQIFEDGFFHADPHPGNLFVYPLEKDNRLAAQPAWVLVFVDFGMVGRVPESLRLGLRELLVAVGTRDATRTIKAYQSMGILLPEADLERLEQASALMFERFWGKDMSELTSVPYEEMRQFADEFRDLLYEMPFQVPQNMIFLARCVGILSGMCTGLDPQFNVWEHLAPYARKLIAEEVRGGREFWLKEIESYARLLLAFPRRLDALIEKVERGEIALKNAEGLGQTRMLERSLRLVAGGLTFAALLLGGIQLYLSKYDTAGVILISAAGINLLWLVWKSRGNYRK